MQVTICPSADSGARFDQFQFAKKKKRNYMAGTHSGLDFRDIGRMHSIKVSSRSGKQNPTPVWVTNDDLLKQVVLLYAENRARGGGPTRTKKKVVVEADYNKRMNAARDRLVDRYLLVQMRLQRMMNRYQQAVKDGAPEKRIAQLRSLVQNADMNAVCLQRNPIVIATAVAYMYWRLDYKSPTIAQELGLNSAVHVRQIVNKLNKCWTRISGEYPKSRYSPSGSMYGMILRPWTPEKLQKLFLLRASGMSKVDCGKALGLHPNTVRFALRTYLKLTKAKVVGKTVTMSRQADGGRAIRYALTA